MKKSIRIGDRVVGRGHPAMLVAEIGINHNGDLDLAKKTIEAAARAGAVSVKFQSYRTEDFIPDRSLTYAYTSQGRRVEESQYDMFKRCELSADDVRELRRHCDAVGIVFHSTPFSVEGIAQLVELGVPVLKNASCYLTNLEMIAAMGATGLPAALSTGMATLSEIDDAVRTFRATGNDGLVLLHCTSEYPAPPEHLHLPKIRALAEAFDCVTGFSDHSEGYTAAVAAVALGACWIEKHFTLDHGLPGPDHWFSSNESEFAELVRAVRAAESALTDAPIGPTDTERVNREEYQLSCQSRAPLNAGHVLSQEDIAFRRPGRGLPPKMAGILVGRTLAHDIAAGHVLQLEDLAS
ncbi:MAG: N-acetylneuraminate synthase family protein [Vulcanimicrobiaceae bacterium]